MALPSMIPWFDFFNLLKIARAQFDLPSSLVITRSAGGDVMRSDRGARLWRVNCAMPPLRNADAAEVRAMMHYLRGAGTTCVVRPKPNPYPAYDPDGTILGASAVTIYDLIAGNRELRLQGLPAGYVLTPGDYLSFNYGTDPIRYAFHQIVVGGTTAGTGITPNIEVVPPIRPGAAVGEAVRLGRPLMKTVVVDGDIGTSGPRITDGMSLTLQQTLRG